MRRCATVFTPVRDAEGHYVADVVTEDRDDQVGSPGLRRPRTRAVARRASPRWRVADRLPRCRRASRSGNWRSA